MCLRTEIMFKVDTERSLKISKPPNIKLEDKTFAEKITQDDRGSIDIVILLLRIEENFF